MERTPINPWPWSVAMGFNQAELVQGHTRTLFCPNGDRSEIEQSPGKWRECCRHE